jgi:ATP-dependent Lon protease
MEILPITGYTEEEKVEIGRRHLIPKLLSQHGLGDQPIAMSDEAIQRMIREYTREPGLRNFGRQLETIIRKIAVICSSGKAIPALIDADDLSGYLGPPRFIPTTEARAPEVGVVNGLGVTPAGGELLLVEALRVPGKGHLIITGRLGDIMRESAVAARSYVQSIAPTLGISQEMFENYDLHLHFPEGAVPKDGPSAGIAIATAIASLLSDRPARTDVAMTGEITLRGKALAVGGIKDKVLAARRAGIHTVILPAQNKNDLMSVPEGVRKDMRYILVEGLDEALRESLIDVVVTHETSVERAVQAERERSGKHGGSKG